MSSFQRNMDTSYESDSDPDDAPNSEYLDQMITETQARFNYEEAGKLVPAEDDQIRIENHEDLIDSSMTQLLDEVVETLALPYNLSDFQKLSLNTLLQKKDLILLSPTGSGKEN